MNAYFVGHNGLGDNLYMIGALHFLLQFYEKIYFLCKESNYPNTTLFFTDTPNIICVPFKMDYEDANIFNIITPHYQDHDVFVCGNCVKKHLKSKITNPAFLNCPKINKNVSIAFDTLNQHNYVFIENFYKDAQLNLTYFYDYHYLPTTQESIDLYNSIRDYYIVFIQTSCSNSQQNLQIPHLTAKYIHDEKVLLVCSNNNLYDLETQPEKHRLCQPFVFNKVVHYTKTILHSDEIYIIDSCLTGIVLPYLKKNMLKTKKVRIIHRDVANRVLL